MGDGFVAGRLDAAGESFGGMYGAFFHAGILAWRVRSKNFNAEVAEYAELGKRKNLYVCTVLAGQHRCTVRNLFPSYYVLSSAGEMYVGTRNGSSDCYEGGIAA
jgi:hypothetical protein